MKRFIFLLTTIFICTIAYAETITINWGVDNQPYTTTTCEIGGDVILPPVSKRGHIFRGWTAEHFNRGTFQTWVDIPTGTNLYEKDFYNNRVPIEGDYIIVNDVSKYLPLENVSYFVRHPDNSTQSNALYVNDINKGKKMEYIISPSDNNSETEYANGAFVVKRNPESPYGGVLYIAKKRISWNGVIYNNGQIFFRDVPGWVGSITYGYYSDDVLNGTWKFIYHGNWENDGKSGWTPVEQIGE